MSNSSNPSILPEVQSDVSKFFDTKIGILSAQEERLEKLLEKVRAYSNSYKISKERALSALLVGVDEINDSKQVLLLPAFEEPISEKKAVNISSVASSVVGKIEQKHLITEDDQEDLALPPSSELLFDKNWNHSQKVQFVVLEPHKYSLETFDGSNSVIDAILKHEPEWGKRESRAVILAKIAPTVSKLVKRGKLLKLRGKGSKGDFRYISIRWFDSNGVVKPEYQDIIAHLEYINPEKKLATAGAVANTESETIIGAKPSLDAAEKLNGQSYGMINFSNSF